MFQRVKIIMFWIRGSQGGVGDEGVDELYHNCHKTKINKEPSHLMFSFSSSRLVGEARA